MMQKRAFQLISKMSVATKAMFLVVALMALAYAFCLPDQLFDVSYSTVVTDRNGQLLGARISADGQWRFPPCHTVPEKVKQCLLTFEDKRFYWHCGVDVFSLARALWQNVKAGRVISGGSTLTMQTIRLSRGKERTLKEKLIEMVLATRLELRESKDDILALYVSHAPFGGNVVGLDAAFGATGCPCAEPTVVTVRCRWEGERAVHREDVTLTDGQADVVCRGTDAFGQAFLLDIHHQLGGLVTEGEGGRLGEAHSLGFTAKQVA